MVYTESCLDFVHITGSSFSDDALLGRWQAPENAQAFVEFTEHGLWFASDGCNSTNGAWSLSDDSSFEAGAGGVLTQVGCDNVPVPSALWSAETASVTSQATSY